MMETDAFTQMERPRRTGLVMFPVMSDHAGNLALRLIVLNQSVEDLPHEMGIEAVKQMRRIQC
ncbi:hypothetical protein D3C81_1377560 [compost metagenome]